MTGFGRRYWLQIVFEDESEQWLPCNLDYQAAIAHAGLKMAADANIAFIVLLDGKVKAGAIPSKKQILADFNRQHRPGSKPLKVAI